MIDIKLLRDNPNFIKEAVARKSYHIDIDEILKLDERRRNLIQEVEELRRNSNEISAAGKETSSADRDKARGIKEKVKIKEKELEVVEDDFFGKFSQIPNPAFSDVAEGKSEKDNKELKVVGEKPKFNFEPQDHLVLAAKLDLVDFKAGAKVAGSQFCYLKN